MIRALRVLAAFTAVVLAAATISLATTPASASPNGCDYVNSDGNCEPGPTSAPSAPSGATAQCRDGTWSSSQHRTGTCSGHGGVDHFLSSTANTTATYRQMDGDPVRFFECMMRNGKGFPTADTPSVAGRVLSVD
jgi:hypothetical protein